mmetsp:Transcript_2250/g.5404  ORF Transcript_2250/g.5404 Transcript_2250/m.5404 type:complete len:92 (+) Transcript_2250:129-404(+)
MIVPGPFSTAAQRPLGLSVVPPEGAGGAELTCRPLESAAGGGMPVVMWFAKCRADSPTFRLLVSLAACGLPVEAECRVNPPRRAGLGRVKG